MAKRCVGIACSRWERPDEPFAWFRRSRLDDISDEIRSHIEEKTDALIAGGMSRADAETAARRAFGNVTNVQQRAREVWRFESFVDSLASDLRLALLIITSPSFSHTSPMVIHLSLGFARISRTA